MGSLTDSYTGLVDVGDVDNFPASGYAAFDEELVAYDSISTTSLNVTARGQYGSTAVSHDAGEPARAVWVADNLNVVDAIEEALTDFADVPASNIPSADWLLEKTDYLALHTLSGVIMEPTSVREQVNKWCEQCSINLFWDERAQEINLSAYGPQRVADFVITDGNLLDAERINIKRELKERVTQVWYFYGKRDHSQDDDASNFADLHLEASLSLEDPAAYGSPAVRQIKAEFISSSAVASAVSGRLLERFKHGRTKLSFSLDASDGDIWTGSVGLLTTDLIQNTDGSSKSVQVIITSAEEIDGHVIRYEAEIFKLEPPVKYARIAPDATPDYLAASEFETGRYGFLSDATPEMSNGDDPYYIA